MIRRLLPAGLLLAALGVLVPGTPAVAENAYPVFDFDSPRIDESSALVDLSAVMITVNDSGGGPFVYAVNAENGATVGTTNYQAPVKDVEALLAAGPNEVWVGDIGDNQRRRSTIAVYRVPIEARDLTVRRTPYLFTYPDGPHDAESMVGDNRGRFYFITKNVRGGTVYRSGSTLSFDRPNPLTKVATVREYATDAALFTNGQHVIVRSYGTAGVYSFPGFKPEGSFALPRQPQGEGISVGPADRIRISSEGKNSEVLQVDLPARVAARMDLLGSVGRQPGADSTATPTPAPSPTPTASPSTAVPAPLASDGDPGAADTVESSSGPSWLIWLVPAVLVVGAAAIGLVLRRRSN